MFGRHSMPPSTGETGYFALMLDTDLRAGEALGMRHEDVATAEKTIK
ncbi:hypothetical protein J3E61_003011 [Mycobacterium sp. OAE908]